MQQDPSWGPASEGQPQPSAQPQSSSNPSGSPEPVAASVVQNAAAPGSQASSDSSQPAQQSHPAPQPSYQAPAPASGAPAASLPPRPAYAPYGAPTPPPAYAYAAPGMPQPGMPQPGVSQPQSQPPQKKRGWIVALVGVIAAFLLLAIGMWSCTTVVAGSLSSFNSFSAVEGPSENTIAIIEIDGTIQYDDSACSPEGLKMLLDEASEDPYIKGVVLRVNSGGGVATAGEEMSQYVQEFDKPIVVSSASMNASAAYEISSQADYIFTAKTTAIGSIGTALEVTDLSGLLEKLGISVDTITSADSKDSSYGYRPLSEEEREYYQTMVDAINDTFIENVAQGRDMTVEEVRELATGLTFTGMEAVENGLADAIGTREDAIAMAAELAGITEYDVMDLGAAAYDIADVLDLLSSQSTNPLPGNGFPAAQEGTRNGNLSLS